MIDTYTRGLFQKLFDVISRPFIKFNIHPIVITIAAFITGIISVFFLASGDYIAFVIILWLSGFLDVLDGTVARLTSRATVIGGFLDLMSDRIIEFSVIIGFAIIMPDIRFSLILFLCSVVFNFSTFLFAALLVKNTGIKSFHYDAGIMERTETFIGFTIAALFNSHAGYIIFVITALIFLTGILRSIKIIQINHN